MKAQTSDIWIWQRIVSPHMVGLAQALALRGAAVTYIASELMSIERAEQGWKVDVPGSIQLKVAATAEEVALLVQAAPMDSVHICQGIRANGRVGVAQRCIARRGLRQWVVMETVEDGGIRGLLKRLEYRRLFASWRNRIEGVLATGYRTPDWVAKRGVDRARIFPFAYFLEHRTSQADAAPAFAATIKFRFMFVGRLIELKKLDFLISALSQLVSEDFELVVIGAGPLEQSLRAFAEDKLSGRVVWRGLLPQVEVPSAMLTADCLVLPSRYDGWGAVLSESLMVGTPTICSSACGAAEVVAASPFGSVFENSDLQGLVAALYRALRKGRLTQEERSRLASWAECLNAASGAEYLSKILERYAQGSTNIAPPWKKKSLLAREE